MKKFLNKTTMAIILAVAMALTLFIGLIFATRGEVAIAAEVPTTVKLTADTTSFCPGTTFKLTITINGSGKDLSSITLQIGPMQDDGYSIDTEKTKNLTLSNATYNDALSRASNTGGIQSENRYKTYGMFFISFGDCDDYNITVGQGFVVATVDVTISSDIDVSSATETELTYNIGIRHTPQNYVNYSDETRAVASDSSLLDEPLIFTVREPSDNNNLSSLKIGQGSDTSAYQIINLTDSAFDKDNIAITVTDLGEPLVIVSETEDGGAKVTLQPGDIQVTDGQGSISIPSDGVVTIQVKAENGDIQTYTLNVKVVGAILTALTVETDTEITGLTKNGLKETFDSSTTEYTIYVPSDSTKVTITATVSTGHSEDTTMELACTGTAKTSATATSGVAFEVTGMEDADTLTITLKASDGDTNSSKSYVITFDKVDVDASLKTITVVGSVTQKTFSSSELKATANNVDYYYMVTGETNASSVVTLAANSSAATVKLNDAEYTAAKTLTEGKHTINILAEAGNSKTYTFYLKNYVALELIEDTVFDFMYEDVIEQYGDEYYYRKTYKQSGLVHGVDDINSERLVIGQVSEYTSINQFLTNFKDTSKIKLYDGTGELFFNLGSVGSDYTEDDLDDPDYYSVGTGWYIEYVVDGNVEETIYISVLGDLDGDGYILSADIFTMSRVITGVVNTFDKVEYRLAGYVCNVTGTIGADDISAVSAHIKNSKSITNYFYNAN